VLNPLIAEFLNQEAMIEILEAYTASGDQHGVWAWLNPDYDYVLRSAEPYIPEPQQTVTPAPIIVKSSTAPIKSA
jgi:hypothetical protein